MHCFNPRIDYLELALSIVPRELSEAIYFTDFNKISMHQLQSAFVITIFYIIVNTTILFFCELKQIIQTKSCIILVPVDFSDFYICVN